jgi:hypothetical protein
MKHIKDNHYHHFQYLCDYFAREIKFGFSGDPMRYTTYELDLQMVCPPIRKYVSGVVAANLQDADWIVEITFDDVKAMFDPVVEQIIGLIRGQIANSKSAIKSMFLVGGFAESAYLRACIEHNFVGLFTEIACPTEPVAAVVRGAAYYGKWGGENPPLPV